MRRWRAARAATQCPPTRAKRAFTEKGGQARQLIVRPASLRSDHDPRSARSRWTDPGVRLRRYTHRTRPRRRLTHPPGAALPEPLAQAGRPRSDWAVASALRAVSARVWHPMLATQANAWKGPIPFLHAAHIGRGQTIDHLGRGGLGSDANRDAARGTVWEARMVLRGLTAQAADRGPVSAPSPAPST